MLLLVRARQLDSSQPLQIHESQTLALPVPGPDGGQPRAGDQPTDSRSTTNTSVSSGPITPPAPCLP
jgi:hypothetical protein